MANYSYAYDRFIKPAFKIKALSAVLINVYSGQIVYQKKADEIIQPASLSRLMTLHLAWNEINRGDVSLEDQVSISKKAWKVPGSKMFLPVNKSYPLETLLKGIAIVAGNDACIAVAEHISGVEEAFVRKMNQASLDIGLTNTRYKNSHGLP
jgi:D-alanyl-D-alanine carboxypeptidase (penicillin-binding protein 5/6)